MMGEYDAGYENCIDAMVRQMEDMQFSIDSLHRENAKLRELCKRVLKNCYDAYEQVVRCRDCRHFERDATPHDATRPHFCCWLGIDLDEGEHEFAPESHYMMLPKDADGEYIHIGDVMAYADNTKPMEAVALVPPAVFLTEDGPRYADMCRHYHAPTVEDVLREFGIDWEHESDCEDRAALLAEYAAKLQLKEDA